MSLLKWFKQCYFFPEKHRYSILIPPLQVVLVELEEISPAQLAMFPESVRHLRKKQGAVCWWKHQGRGPTCRTFLREAQDEEKCKKAAQRPSPDLSPSSRFWKEMRYHMPVRGKRVVYPEKTALLDLKWGCRIGGYNTHTVNLTDLDRFWPWWTANDIMDSGKVTRNVNVHTDYM